MGSFYGGIVELFLGFVMDHRHYVSDGQFFVAPVMFLQQAGQGGWAGWSRPEKTANLSNPIFECIDLKVSFLCYGGGCSI